MLTLAGEAPCKECNGKNAIIFYLDPVGQFYRVRSGHLWCQKCSSLTNVSLSVSSGSYCTSVIVGSRVYSNTLATLFTHYPTVWKVKCSVVGTGVLVVL